MGCKSFFFLLILLLFIPATSFSCYGGLNCGWVDLLSFFGIVVVYSFPSLMSILWQYSQLFDRVREADDTSKLTCSLTPKFWRKIHQNYTFSFFIFLLYPINPTMSRHHSPFRCLPFHFSENFLFLLKFFFIIIFGGAKSINCYSKWFYRVSVFSSWISLLINCQ